MLAITVYFTADLAHSLLPVKQAVNCYFPHNVELMIYVKTTNLCL